MNKVKLVGILNVTPDSFSDGGQFLSPKAAIAQAEKLFADGADLIDIGAESTRPNAAQLTPEEEWQRLEPVLSNLLVRFPGQISLDSFHPETIELAFAIAPVIVNDVTGMNNPAMVGVVIKHQAICIVSHLPGSDIQAAHRDTPVTTLEQIKIDLLQKQKLLTSRSLPAENIILDPGIGFGKTMELNQELLKFAERVPNQPIMIGYSRKRFLGENRMEIEPNLAACKVAVESGAAYLRVHDVAAHAAFMRSLNV